MNLKRKRGRKAAAILGLAILVMLTVSQMAGAWWTSSTYLIWRGGW
jgi:divalent metal cation (Fe/Co/Zn/Cd) transporter